MKRWWCVLLLMVVPGLVGAQDATTPRVTPATIAKIAAALGKGDVPALAKLYHSPPDPATRVLAAMALERIHFNLDQATADARVCERSLLATQPRVAYFCAVFANGDIRLAHGEHAADLDEADMVRRFAGKMPDATLGHLRAYLAQVEKTHAMQVHEPAGTFDIRLDRALTVNMQTITIESNGTSLPLVVDTGGGAITVGATWARRLGVHLTGRVGLASGVLTHGIKVQHGILDKVRFGAVTLENVPVQVVPGRHRIIGIDILRHLGNLRLAKGKLTVYAGGAAMPACHQPMLIASSPWGQSLRLLTAVQVNDTLYTPLVDSGNSFFLSASQPMMDKLNSGDNMRLVMHGMGPRKHHTRTNWTDAVVRISGQPFKLALPIFKDARIPWDFVLGSGALDYVDFYFDFTDHRTCMLLHDNLH